MPVIHRRSMKLWLPDPGPRAPTHTEDPKVGDLLAPSERDERGAAADVSNFAPPGPGAEGLGVHRGNGTNVFVNGCKESEQSCNAGDELDELMREYEKQAADDLKSIQATPKAPANMMDRLEAGLSTRLEANNKGWRLLAQMGYKDGEGLGIKKQGRTDPVEVNLKRGRGGLGTDKAEKRRKAEIAAKKEVIGASHVVAYRSNASNKYGDRRMEEQVEKARGVVENLDVKMGLQRSHLWLPERKPGGEEEGEGADQEQPGDEDPNAEWEALPVSDRLMEILMYLRRNYRYCFWCGDKFGDDEGACPGVLESDH